MGRKKNAPPTRITIAEQKSARIQLLITPTLNEWLREEAQKNGESLNAYINHLLEDAYFDWMREVR